MTAREFDLLFQRYVAGTLRADDAAALKEALLEEEWQQRWVELSDIEGALADEFSVESEEAVRRAVASAEAPRPDSTRTMKPVVLKKHRRQSERIPAAAKASHRRETRVTRRVLVVEEEPLSRPVRSVARRPRLPRSWSRPAHR